MNWLRKKHGAALIVWLVLTIVAVVCLPNTSRLVREKGQINLPASSESARANRLAQKIGDKKGTDSVAIVYHKSSKITKADQKQINKKVSKLEKHKARYHVTTVTSAKDGGAVAKQVISKNGRTELVNIALKKGAGFDQRAQQVKNQLAVSGIKTYVTSDQLLDDEFSNVAEEGIKKTEVVAVVFILIVLILVFRSVIVPLVSLLSVGIAMFISLSLVMNMAKYFNFPISDFTQVFLVIILFGIGTDYNILLYDKFKEALGDHDRYQAIDIVKKTAAHTVLYSGLSVFIGFAALALAKFSFYRSAVSCSVGIIVLLLVLLTLNYFFMATLGRKLFWPSKKFNGEQKSMVWSFLARQGVRRPLLYLGVFVAIAGIAIAKAPQLLNYNSADEIPNSNPIKRGYLIAQQDFSKGKISPVTINIQSTHALDNQADLAAIDSLTNALKKETGVKQVMSVTQPTGRPIKQLYVGNQLATLLKGMQQAQTGLGTIKAGLQSADSQLSSANLQQGLEQVQRLADGSQQLAGASNQLTSGLNQYVQGTSQYVNGASQLTGGLGQLNAGVAPFANGISNVTAASQELNQQVTAANRQIQQLAAISGSNPSAQQIAQLNQGTSQLAGALTTINRQLPTLTNGISQLTNGSQSLANGGSQLISGGSQLMAGSQSLNSGISQVNAGVQQLNQQLQALSGQVSQLQTGLDQAVTGIAKVQAGISTASSYLTDLRKSPTGKQFNIPKSQLQASALHDSYQTYMSNDRKITQISVVLKEDPSGHTAAKDVARLTRDIKAQTKATALDGATVAVGGQSSQIVDLEQLAQHDFKRTALIMIAGIGIALLFVTRSVMETGVIVGTLIGTYYAAIDLTAQITGHFFSNSQLTWNAPFFAFIMLFALGVDYSIFLMMRYRNKELVEPQKQVDHILSSATTIGAVVISAIIILSGTFAALLPSGVLTLIQVAVIVIIGLMILMVALPVVISAYIKLAYGNSADQQS